MATDWTPDEFLDASEDERADQVLDASDDERADPFLDAGEDERADWVERWTSPCPDGWPQRPAICLGYREREPGRLQLRVALGGTDNGVCDVMVEEDDATIHVRLLVCYDEDQVPIRKETDCPVHVYLQEPLGERTVIDVETGRPVPLFVPSWG